VLADEARRYFERLKGGPGSSRRSSALDGEPQSLWCGSRDGPRTRRKRDLDAAVAAIEAAAFRSHHSKSKRNRARGWWYRRCFGAKTTELDLQDGDGGRELIWHVGSGLAAQ